MKHLCREDPCPCHLVRGNYMRGALAEYERRVAVAREALYAVTEQEICACPSAFVETDVDGKKRGRGIHMSACYVQQARRALRVLNG